MSTREIETLLAKVREIEGMLTDKEAVFLYGLAKSVPKNGTVVEIGSYKGKSTTCLALGAKNGNGCKIYAVDWHRGWKNVVSGGSYREFSRNIKKAGVSRYVTPVIMKSEHAAKKWAEERFSINVLWIDGSHDYEDVRKDFTLWDPFVAENGVIAFHDSFWDGPYRVFNKHILSSGNFSSAGLVDYIAFAFKTRPSKMEKLRNARLIFLRSLLKYPMRIESVHPGFVKKLIKNKLLSSALAE